MQGMCPHEFYLGTCTCIKLLKQYTAEMYPRMKNFLSFFEPKKNWVGGPEGKGFGNLHLTYFNDLTKLTYFIQQIKKEKDQF